MKKIKVKPFDLFLILVFLMPMHTLVFTHVLAQVKLLSLWRDAIIIILLIASLRNYKLNATKLGLCIIVSSIIIIIYACTALNFASLNTARTYILPLLIYFYTSNKKLNDSELDALVKMCLISATLVSIWGLLQAYVLGPQVLFDLGYPNYQGKFASASFYIAGWEQQRVVSTFSSPNACGAYLAIMIIFLISMREYSKPYTKIFWLSLVIITLALIATFSRSSWIGALAGLLLFSKHHIRVKKKTIKSIAIAIVSVVLLTVIFYSYNNSVRIILDMMVNHIGRTVKKEDASFLYHISELYKPLDVLINNPLGLGFGKNGPFALSHLNLEQTNQVESSIWLMAYEIGIIGMIVYFIPYAISIVRFAGKKHEKLILSSAKITICILLIFCVLPSVQSFELPFFAMLFAGIAENRHKEFS